MIAHEGCGAVVYLTGHEGRSIGRLGKLDADPLQDCDGLVTVETNPALRRPGDMRDCRVGAHILRELGAHRVRLLTNNPDKCAGLERCGIAVSERVPLITDPTQDNLAYLDARRRRQRHMSEGELLPVPANVPG